MAQPGSPCRSHSGAVTGTYHTGRFTKVPQLAKLLRVPTQADRVPGQPWRPGPARPRLRRPTRTSPARTIEHNYRELKHGLGLDRFEGRSWNGWHHHATLVTVAHAFLTGQRLAPKADTPNSPSTRSSTLSRTS